MDTLAWTMLAALGDGQIRELLGKEVAQVTGPLPVIKKVANIGDNMLRLWVKADERTVVLPGHRHHLVGRSPDCDLRLSSPYAARHQATLIREGNNWFLRDNDSKNGTYVNGKRLRPGELALLKRGDSISFARKEEVEVI